jgi:glycosyltransferase involved in cell wall biosynthesis
MISLCMPYYMRQSALDRSLASIRSLYTGLDYEVVIADDGSPVPVKADGCTIVQLPVKHHAMNPCVPINWAVQAARGDVIVLTNPEIEHRMPVLGSMLTDLTPDGYVIAACQDVSGPWLCHSTVKGGENGRGPMPDGSGFHFCTMLTRDLFDKAGGFDEAYRAGQAFEDNDWLFRLQQAGAHFIMRNDLVVWHHKVPCVWPAGGHARNRGLFEAKWGVTSG